MKRIYLDYASLTPLDKKVGKEMKKYSSEKYGNPSALYASGVAAKKAVGDAKERIAAVLHAHADELVFTSGGTETNHLVLNSFASEQIVTSVLEHSSIMHRDGMVKVAVTKSGLIDLDALKLAITPTTRLVSIMLVNNEIGTIQPIHEVAKIVRDMQKKYGTKILLHTDASQGMYLPLHVEKLGVDLMTVDGAKMYGPRGVGLLYVKRGTLDIDRPGTENVSGICGLALALELAEKKRDKESTRLLELKKFFVASLQKILPTITLQGDLVATSPHILNVSFPLLDKGFDNEFFILQLDAQGIECSTKSACLKDEDESYVLRAIGAESRSSVRFSFGRATSKSDLQKTLKVIQKILARFSL